MYVLSLTSNEKTAVSEYVPEYFACSVTATPNLYSSVSGEPALWVMIVEPLATSPLSSTSLYGIVAPRCSVITPLYDTVPTSVVSSFNCAFTIFTVFAEVSTASPYS